MLIKTAFPNQRLVTDLFVISMYVRTVTKQNVEQRAYYAS